MRSPHLLDQLADQFGGREGSRQWRSLACPLRAISGLTLCLRCSVEGLARIVSHRIIRNLSSGHLCNQSGETVGKAARGPAGDARSHNRLVRGAAGQCCAISLVRRGFRACDEGRAKLRGGSAELQDGGNATSSYDKVVTEVVLIRFANYFLDLAPTR